MNLKRITLKPVYWAILMFVLAQAITIGVASRENAFLEANDIYVPSQTSTSVSLWPETIVSESGQVVSQTPAYSSLGPIIIYFGSMVLVLGVVLFLIPVSALKKVFRWLFAFLFAWGVFIISVLWLPLVVGIILSVAVGLLWFFMNKVWLHNLVMVLAMVALGAVFGRFISPWTAMALLGVLAIYDFLAVRFGYMIWMADKLGQLSALPAFTIPGQPGGWLGSVQKFSPAGRTVEGAPASGRVSILGGGDIGFPLLLSSSAYFAYGLGAAVIVAGFSLVGLIGAYWLQGRFFKGKPIPALPPIAVVSLIGLLIVA